MVDVMKVITIKQPWDSLIVEGYKEYEFRTWNTKYRGDNEVIDHVGIVEKVQNGYVDYKDVKRKKYKLNNNVIYAYGVPEYSV